MAYIVKIKRDDPIEADEIQDIIEELDGLRLNAESELDGLADDDHIEVLDPAKNEWIPAFRFREEEGCISFRGSTFTPENGGKFVWVAAGQLALALSGRLEGEEDVHFDPITFDQVPGTPAWKLFQTNFCEWDCKCKPGMGDECCADLFEAMSCHGIFAALKKTILGGLDEVDGTLVVRGKPGVSDFAVSRTEDGKVQFTTTESARNVLKEKGIVLKNLSNFEIE